MFSFTKEQVEQLDTLESEVSFSHSSRVTRDKVTGLVTNRVAICSAELRSKFHKRGPRAPEPVWFAAHIEGHEGDDAEKEALKEVLAIVDATGRPRTMSMVLEDNKTMKSELDLYKEKFGGLEEAESPEPKLAEKPKRKPGRPRKLTNPQPATSLVETGVSSTAPQVDTD